MLVARLLPVQQHRQVSTPREPDAFPAWCTTEWCLKSKCLCSQPLASRDLPPCKYYRQSLAEAMGAPLEGMVRVGTLQGATREASLEAALKKHEISNAEKAATVQGGSPAKRARCSNNTVSRGHENAMENKSGKASLSPAATAESVPLYPPDVSLLVASKLILIGCDRMLSMERRVT